MNAGRSQKLRPTRGGALLAMDVGGTKTNLACYDSSTGSLRRATVDTHAPRSTGQQVLLRLVDAAKSCLQDATGRSLLVMAAVFPGVVNGRQLLMAPNASKLEGIDLRKAFADAFGNAAVILGNDVKAAALAEHEWGGLSHVDQALYVNIGTGLAAAAIINGEVYAGHHGAALEIGYQRTSFREGGRASRSAPSPESFARLETVFSGASLDRLARKILGPSFTAKHLFESPRRDVQQQLQCRIDVLAAQLVNLAIAWDVERIAVGGGVSQQYLVFGPILEQRLERLVPFPPMLVSARFVLDASLWGALELARRAAHLPALPHRLFATQANNAHAAQESTPATTSGKRSPSA